MNLFYHPNITTADTEIRFEKEESRHITKVLRRSKGDLLHITNGNGQFFIAKLTSVTPKQSIATILETSTAPHLPYRLHMAVAPTKNNDRFEWFLEKATEIGIHKITPIFCDHSERKVIKPERFDKIIESAMKQSLKAYKPILSEALSFKEFIESEKKTTGLKCIAHCEEGAKAMLKEFIPLPQEVLILIGPEGDFSTQEIELALSNDFSAISLGQSRLRTETAAIVACHSISHINQ
ncbi:MAG: 16S rRNA (uracil(1498)-N(3))-methyltransferase [Bacteroidetes bacterium]|nr:16S rRNA (uracil(1498)-N(3))-methyltransferase [Bacteroidota bacterium]